MPAHNRSAVETALASAPPSRLMAPKRESDRLLERFRTLTHLNSRGGLDRGVNGRANPTTVTGASITSCAHDARQLRLVRLANDAYREWRGHCAQLTRAFRCWVDADSSRAEQAWEAYEDALALEEIAAARYAERAARVESAGRLDLDPITCR
jgi:hypothetical protein